MSDRRSAWVIAGLVLLLLGLGCDKLKTLTGDKGAPSSGATGSEAPAAAGDPDVALGQKLNEYIVCINKASSSALKSRSRYLGWVDAKTGPTGSEKVVYGLFKINLVDQCQKALKKAKTMSPSTPELEKAAAEYEKALDKLVPLVDQAHTYYQSKKYTEDSMKQGKQMHGPLMAAFDEFVKADGALRGGVARINDEMAVRELARIEQQEGKKLFYHWKSMMLKAKQLVRAGDAPDLPELDLAKLEPAIKEFETAHKATDEYAAGHGAEVKKVMMFSNALGDATNFLAAAREMATRKRDNKPWSQGDIMMINRNNAWMVAGHPAKFVRKYNDLVNSSNGLRW